MGSNGGHVDRGSTVLRDTIRQDRPKTANFSRLAEGCNPVINLIGEPMNGHDLPRDSYSDSPALTPALSPAHSGPELASYVPDSRLAQQLAQELLSNTFELTQRNNHTSSGMAVGFTIGLDRR